MPHNRQETVDKLKEAISRYQKVANHLALGKTVVEPAVNNVASPPDEENHDDQTSPEETGND